MFRGTPKLTRLGYFRCSAEHLRSRPAHRASTYTPLRELTRRSIATLVIALALTAPAGAGAQATAEPQASLPDIEDEVMCPVCGTLLELASEDPQAQRERAFIRDLIAQGYTKDEIKDALVAEYGEEILATPGNEGFDLAAWIVPALAVLGGAVAIGVGLRRWRRDGGGGPEGRAQGSAPIGKSDTDRLDADLARYDR